MRETYEETNLKLKKEQLIKDCGILNYNKKKNLHIYMFEIDEKPNNLKCKATDSKSVRCGFESCRMCFFCRKINLNI